MENCCITYYFIFVAVLRRHSFRFPFYYVDGAFDHTLAGGISEVGRDDAVVVAGKRHECICSLRLSVNLTAGRAIY